ncbi:MAG: DUF4827 domain-containing protein [Candidatus Amulumruptor caecigallinarius]|nr:DUF4827 domain-containing protein [Candidatus Amulumruptor caecigallinarius]
MKIRNCIKKANICVALLALSAGGVLSSCDDDKSYADMLREEEIAVNWYLAQNKVEVGIPQDSNFQVGPEAPFYKMDGDGNVYMRVVNKGNMQNRPKTGEVVYFRFMRQNIKYLKNYGDGAGSDGNADNMDSSLNGMCFIFGNTTLQSTLQYGSGIQVPLKYLGYDCEVDLIVKSVDGFSGDISQCNPYIYKGLKYFKAEY